VLWTFAAWKVVTGISASVTLVTFPLSSPRWSMEDWQPNISDALWSLKTIIPVYKREQRSNIVGFPNFYLPGNILGTHLPHYPRVDAYEGNDLVVYFSSNVICFRYDTWYTRSTRTVHTSAKACLTSVAIRIRIHDLDRHQNLIISSMAHCRPSLKISCKAVWKVLRKVTNRQTITKT